jgi:hypothetical protein
MMQTTGAACCNLMLYTYAAPRALALCLCCMSYAITVLLGEPSAALQGLHTRWQGLQLAACSWLVDRWPFVTPLLLCTMHASRASGAC